MNGWRELFWKVTGGLTLAAALTAAAFAGTRASNEDVKKNEERIEAVQLAVNKRLRGLETNTIKICQLLDRQDKAANGPGLDCKDPE